jgi:hypothetical protein
MLDPVTLGVPLAAYAAKLFLRGIGEEVGNAAAIKLLALLKRPEPDPLQIKEAIETVVANAPSEQQAQALVSTLQRSLLPLHTYTSKGGVELLRKYPASTTFALANVDALDEGGKAIALLESDAVRESRPYKEFRDAVGIDFDTYTVGYAQAHDRGTLDMGLEQFTDHRPGRAVSHAEGQAGTLGLYVKRRDNSNVTGFCSASHVLRWKPPSDDNPEPEVLSPAPPPEKYRNDGNAYGYYQRGQVLVPYTNAAADDLTLNSVDIAWARLKRPADTPNGNRVPNPDEPSKFVRLKGLLTPEEVKRRVIRHRQEPFVVHKIGRASGFTRGNLFAGFGTPKSVAYRNASYLYTGYCVVSPENKEQKFSVGGDSGAVVYSRDLMIVGFVVASTSGACTLVHLAYDCLDAMELDPLL